MAPTGSMLDFSEFQNRLITREYEGISFYVMPSCKVKHVGYEKELFGVESQSVWKFSYLTLH